MPPWGGHQNGRIPSSAMRKATVITGANGLLREDASLSLDRLGLLAIADGYDTRVTDLYRTYATQVILKESWCNRGRCQMAATPGTSNHGWGDAVDNGYGYGPKSFGRWMHAKRSLCREHGWIWPAWAQRPNTYELWHWEYLAHLDQHRNQQPVGSTQEDEDMYKFGTTADKNKIFQRVINGIMGRTRELGWVDPNVDSLGALRPDGNLGPVSRRRYQMALGRMEDWFGLDFPEAMHAEEVDPLISAALMNFNIWLGEQTGRIPPRNQ